MTGSEIGDLLSDILVLGIGIWVVVMCCRDKIPTHHEDEDPKTRRRKQLMFKVAGGIVIFGAICEASKTLYTLLR